MSNALAASSRDSVWHSMDGTLCWSGPREIIVRSHLSHISLGREWGYARGASGNGACAVQVPLGPPWFLPPRTKLYCTLYRHATPVDDRKWKSLIYRRHTLSDFPKSDCLSEFHGRMRDCTPARERRFRAPIYLRSRVPILTMRFFFVYSKGCEEGWIDFLGGEGLGFGCGKLLTWKRVGLYCDRMFRHWDRYTFWLVIWLIVKIVGQGRIDFLESGGIWFEKAPIYFEIEWVDTEIVDLVFMIPSWKGSKIKVNLDWGI